MKPNTLKCAFKVSSRKFMGFIVNQQGTETNPKKIKVFLDMHSPSNLKHFQSLIRRIRTLNHFVLRATIKGLPFFDTLHKNNKFK